MSNKFTKAVLQSPFIFDKNWEELLDNRDFVKTVLNANLNIGYKQERSFILKYCLLEKAVYELGYELNSRPRWALIPLKGISNIINH